jgi:hypothetical protein
LCGGFEDRVDLIDRRLPHERMTMVFHHRDDQAIIQATDDSAAPDERVRVCAGHPTDPNGSVILDDLERETFEVIEPADFWERARRRIPIVADRAPASARSAVGARFLVYSRRRIRPRRCSQGAANR